MISALEGIKKQIRDAKQEEIEENQEIIIELKKKVEHKNKEREKILKENLRLSQMTDELMIKMRIEEVSQELRKQIAENEEIEKKIEQLEEFLGMNLNKSCFETRAFTDRNKVGERLGKSPLRPPRGKDVKITNSLAFAIEQAQKTLKDSKKEINRPISPCLSFNTLRSDTPPNIRRMNTSLIYNN